MIKITSMLMVGAAGRGVGKTTFTCSLIERFGSQCDVVGIKISVVDSVNKGHHPDVTGSGGGDSLLASYCISEEKDNSAGKDTSRMLASGAKRVLWLQVMNTHLEEGIRALLETLGDETVSICESNRARRIVEPGVFIMMSKCKQAGWKPSAQEVAPYADRVSTKLDIDLNDIQLLHSGWAIKMQATAIVMAGGNNTRMGRDKSMLPIDGQPMIKHISRQLVPYFRQILVSSNHASRYGFLGVHIVPDAVTDRGPLMGITSALRVSSNEVNFVIACDIPEIDTGLVKSMLRQVGDYDAVVPVVGPMRYEPLFAVYRKSALPTLEQSLQSGSNRVVDALSRCRVKYIELPGRPLKNINTMGDYRGLIRSRTDDSM
ncbi:MAG: NTP transferase domain-containing protein [Planctomycetota bacterium]